MRLLAIALRLAALMAIALLLLASTALADGGYELTWSTVDSGGGSSTGGGYALSGTIGQPDAGVLTGAPYVLAGGFWGGVPAAFKTYLPAVLRGQ
jgi:hypothetical protein